MTSCSEAKAVPVYISEKPVARVVGVHHKSGETSISNFVKNHNYEGAKNLSRIQINLTGSEERFSIDSNSVETIKKENLHDLLTANSEL